MAYSNAHVLKNFDSIEVDGVEMKSQIWKIELTPDQPVQVQRAFDGGVNVDTDTPSWTAAITCFNSRKAGAFVKALDTARAAGDTVDIVVQPKAGTGQDVATFTVTPVAVGFGGEIGSWHQAEIELPVVDQPVFSAAA